MIKCKILSLVDNFLGWVRTVGIVYGYTVFLDRAKLELQSETDIWGPRNLRLEPRVECLD